MSEDASRIDVDGADLAELAGQLARCRTVPEFTMHAISTGSGVPPETIRSWERRYGFPEPERTSSNRRLYSQRDIVAVRWIAGQSHRGNGVRASIGTLRRLIDRANQPAPATTPATATPIDALARALEDGDMATASCGWCDLAILLPSDHLCERVLLPVAMRLAGPGQRPLARGRAEAFLLRKAMVLLDAAQPDEGARDVTILTASHPAPSVPALVLGATLARAGYRLTHPLASVEDSATILMLREDPPADLTIVVTPDAPAWLEASLPRGERATLRLWWPDPPADATDGRWLPNRLGAVIEALC